MYATREEPGFQEGTASEKAKEVKRGGDVSEEIPPCSPKRHATLTCVNSSPLYALRAQISEENSQVQGVPESTRTTPAETQ